jgi:DNA (cytosine-5)-methyltransferase 1
VKPLLLDTFCKAGGCSVGYARAGFDVVGCDIEPQPHYPFPFVEGDALELLRCLLRGGLFRDSNNRTIYLEDVAVIHASPPCQKYSQVNRRQHLQGRDYPDLIVPTRKLLLSIGKPWIIENVEMAPLRGAIRLCGTAFNLPIRRHRIFESSFFLFGVDCVHSRFKEKKYPTCFQSKGEPRRKSSVVQCYGATAGVGLWPDALGIDWMNRKEMSQAIPPAYTHYIGKQILLALPAPTE